MNCFREVANAGDQFNRGGDKFSELLNNLEHCGDCYTITRKGKPVASLVPIEATQRGPTLAELRTIVQALPRLDGSDIAGMVGSRTGAVTPGFTG